MGRILIFLIAVSLVGFLAFQFYLYKSSQAQGCGGDFSYRTTCRVGTYCRSLNLGRLAGGTCQPYLAPAFDLLRKIPLFKGMAGTPSPAETKPLPTDSVEGKFCGGFAANLPQNQCPAGYRCQPDDNYPDASGHCVKQ